MTKTLPIVVGVLFAVSALGQTDRSRAIVWGGDKACAFRGSGFAPDETISCSLVSTPRGPVNVVTHNDLDLAVSFGSEGDRIVVAAIIKNNSPVVIDLDTDLWGAAHYRSVESFYAGKRPFMAETAIPSRDIVRGVRSGVMIDNSADVFLASISKSSEVREVRRQDGTRVKKVVIIDDPDAVENADARNASRSQAADSETEKIRKTALIQKWVPANGSVKGLVYFRRSKKAGLVVFSFRVGDVVYIFRVPRNTA